jgi:hypothetical protein
LSETVAPPNFIRQIVEEDLRSVDRGAASERGRLRLPQPQRYIKAIRFGNREPATTEGPAPDTIWNFVVVFDYGDHDPLAPGLAPDREGGTLGTDNNYEYRLEGNFTGGQVYEPASNTFYPEFVLTGYNVISTAAPNIFKDRRALDPKIRLLTPPL